MDGKSTGADGVDAVERYFGVDVGLAACLTEDVVGVGEQVLSFKCSMAVFATDPAVDLVRTIQAETWQVSDAGDLLENDLGRR